MVQRIPTSGPPSHNLSFSTVLSGRMQNIYNKICGYHDLNIVTMYALENHNKRYPTFLNYSSLLKYKEANPKVWIQISQKADLKLSWMSARCLLWLWRSHTLCKGSTSYKIRYLSISFSMVCQSSLLTLDPWLLQLVLDAGGCQVCIFSPWNWASKHKFVYEHNSDCKICILGMEIT